LLLASHFLQFDAVPGHLFEVFIQLGAIMAVMVLYWRKIFSTMTGLFTDPVAQKFAVNIIVAALPALVMGALAHSWIKGHLYVIPVIASALLVGGFVILWLERRLGAPKITHIDAIPLRTAFVIGIVQVFALIPGVSRAGATIMGALAMGLSRPVAAEFSFFLAMPVMWAAVLYDTYKNRDALSAIDNVYLLFTGFGVAFITALITVKFVIGLVNRWGFTPFAWYRIILGSVLLLFFI
jgi:undecaprenyl-diphosphatase